MQRYWGYGELRPLQEEAIQTVIEQRDSLVVMPTGGGKSLCYQVPPALVHRTDVVVSPLISLMKDQVDRLRQCGYRAAALHSGQPTDVQRKLEAEIRSRRHHLVFVSPERLLTPRFLRLLDDLPVRAFAIDEAHCISHWGHDFRPPYRRLALLKDRFKGASVHAYTATATERVRRDIVEQLRLHDPVTLVGTFDRPNLAYHVIPRVDRNEQILEVIRRHAEEAAIVYCISRNETERLSAWLQAMGIRAACYHAGLSSDRRRDTQDRFAIGDVDVVVATVAFGMGIDRSDVRCVIHAGLPKSIEHYQQQVGRAGRDGLDAECVLFYSSADAMKWERLIRKGAEDAEQSAEAIEGAIELLSHMRAFAADRVCRHKALSEYFGQPYDKPSCGACDICVEATEPDRDGTVVAQKVLSCVARVDQRFGLGHIVKILTGSKDKFIRHFGHHKLSTFGLLKGLPPKTLANLVYQLIDQGVLDRTATDRPLLKLNAASWEIMHGERSVRLVLPKQRVVKATSLQGKGWIGVDRGLFESLRDLRRELAAAQGTPAWRIFNDATLRDMARHKPASEQEFLGIQGVGRWKFRTYGPRFLDHIRAWGSQASPGRPATSASARPGRSRRSPGP